MQKNLTAYHLNLTIYHLRVLKSLEYPQSFEKNILNYMNINLSLKSVVTFAPLAVHSRMYVVVVVRLLFVYYTI